MDKNGAAIYNTRITKNYQDGTTFFTENKKEGNRYALVCLKEGEKAPATVEWNGNVPKKGSSMKWLKPAKR